MPDKAWELLRAGDIDSGLNIMSKRYQDKPTASTALELGNGYLFVGQYKSAWRHLDHFNKQDKRPASIIFSMAGVAKWCSDRPLEAISEWRAGTEAEYQDWAGGIECPLLLFFASNSKHHPFREIATEADRLLQARVTKQHHIKHWPGPLAEYVLDQIDEAELRRRCYVDGESEAILYDRQCDFYVAVRARAAGDNVKSVELFKKIADISSSDLQGENFFLGCMWQPEFFLARYEIANVT